MKRQAERESDMFSSFTNYSLLNMLKLRMRLVSEILEERIRRRKKECREMAEIEQREKQIFGYDLLLF